MGWKLTLYLRTNQARGVAFQSAFLPYQPDQFPRTCSDRNTGSEAETSPSGNMAFCIAHAVPENKSVKAYPKGRKHLVIFDDVDVFLPVEQQLDGTAAAIPIRHQGRPEVLPRGPS
jgi:hypothetical protein